MVITQDSHAALSYPLCSHHFAAAASSPVYLWESSKLCSALSEKSLLPPQHPWGCSVVLSTGPPHAPPVPPSQSSTQAAPYTPRKAANHIPRRISATRKMGSCAGVRACSVVTGLLKSAQKCLQKLLCSFVSQDLIFPLRGTNWRKDKWEKMGDTEC